ncbi:hypothetical protein ACULNC_24910 [Shigella flexneri]
MIDAYITTKTDLTNGWSALESIFEHYLDYIIDNNKNLIPIQEVMPIIGWNELEKISLEYITGKVNAIVSKLLKRTNLKLMMMMCLKTYSMAGLCISQYMRKT